MVALLQPLAQVRQPLGTLLARLAEVGARRERAAGAGDQDGSHRLVGGEALDRLAQVDPELQVPGVELVGAVVGDRRGASATATSMVSKSGIAGTLVSDASHEKQVCPNGNGCIAMRKLTRGSVPCSAVITQRKRAAVAPGRDAHRLRVEWTGRLPVVTGIS